jgi:hypothetical protein
MIVKNNGTSSNSQSLNSQYQKHLNQTAQNHSFIQKDTHKEYQSNYLNSSQSNLNTTANASAATLLLTNILNNLNEKDQASQSFL